jgi:hypothetical protein
MSIAVPPVRLLTADDVAARFQLSRHWVLDHAAGRRRPFLPSLKVGRSVRFEPDAVEQFVVDFRRLAEDIRERGRAA